MHAGKAALLVILGAVVLAAGVFTFVPTLRPALVQKWFQQAKGFTPATSPEDALDKLKQAVEKRDYESALTYVTGDYAEFLKKGGPDAAELAKGIDELRDVMKTTGTKSDKVDYALFMLDPFPVFKVGSVTKASKGSMATINWADEAARYSGAPSIVDWKINRLLMHSLVAPGLLQPQEVVIKDTGEGWKVELPVSFGDRHLRDTVEALRKNATNYRNALRDVKNSIKNNPAVKEDFEREFKANLEKSN